MSTWTPRRCAAPARHFDTRSDRASTASSQLSVSLPRPLLAVGKMQDLDAAPSTDEDIDPSVANDWLGHHDAEGAAGVGRPHGDTVDHLLDQQSARDGVRGVAAPARGGGRGDGRRPVAVASTLAVAGDDERRVRPPWLGGGGVVERVTSLRHREIQRGQARPKVNYLTSTHGREAFEASTCLLFVGVISPRRCPNATPAVLRGRQDSPVP